MPASKLPLILPHGYPVSDAFWAEELHKDLGWGENIQAHFLNKEGCELLTNIGRKMLGSLFFDAHMYESSEIGGIII